MRHVSLAGVLALTLVMGFASLQTVSVEARQGTSATQMGVPAGELSLGSVTIGRDVMANGQPLKRGTYRLRLTSQDAMPVPAGQTAQLERWVEFLKGSKVVGREVVSIVPQGEIADVAAGKPPAPGTSRVELLKGNDYLRIWVNRGGNHYLIHLPTGATT